MAKNKTLLKLNVPIADDAQWEQWFEHLRSMRTRVMRPMTWLERGYIHPMALCPSGHYFRLAYIRKAPNADDVLSILHEYLGKMPAPTIEFDKLNVYTCSCGPRIHVISLTASNMPQEFLAAVDAMRQSLKAAGCTLEEPFRPEIILGKILAIAFDLSVLQKEVALVPPPRFTLKLTNVDYQETHGHQSLYQTQLKSQATLPVANSCSRYS